MKLIDLGTASEVTKENNYYYVQQDASKEVCSSSPTRYYPRSNTNSADIDCVYTG